MNQEGTNVATKASKAITVEVVAVTTKQAREWLENNHVNRNLRPKVVDAYRRDMEAGRWEFTAEPIQISRTGALINGQHRLLALSEAKGVRSLDFVVASGLSDEAQAMMDQGVSRKIADALTITHGHVKNLTLVSAITRWTCLQPQAGPHMSKAAFNGKVSAAEALQVYSAEMDLLNESAYHAAYLRHSLMVSPTAIGYSWSQLARVDESATNEFFSAMVDMEWSLPNDPRKAALRRLHALKRDVDFKTGLESGVIVVSVLTRAWNTWRKGEELDTIHIKGKGSQRGIVPPVTPI
jgi:hypothetical protein